MQRRDVLRATLSAGLLAAAGPHALAQGAVRVRPGMAGWPSAEEWEGLQRATGGRLMALASPFAACVEDGAGTRACERLLRDVRNPCFIGDHPALTQTSGWQDAWTSQPSAYAVKAHGAADVAAAVDFARKHNLRLVVKGGGHSYLGGSSAPDSLLVWTRAMNGVALHDAFVAQGCDPAGAQPAVSLGAGAMWSDAYSAVTTRGGRYVQGGGCTSVGVAGLVQGGGFGNFSKRYGLACASLLEAEVVTADGVVRIANAATHPDLFWALKGGGGGSFGIVTRLTLRTHALPATFGGVFGEIRADSDAAFRALLARFVAFYGERLFNPHWGETVALRGGRRLGLSMVCEGLAKDAIEAAWAPFFAWVRARPEYTFAPPFILSVPAQSFWDPAVMGAHMTRDDRPGASADHFVWSGDREQAGAFLHGYQSAWLPAGLLAPDSQARLVDALQAASRQWDVQLHFNKGLAGAPDAALAASRDTAMNPAVVDAFALAIAAGGSGPAYPGMPGPGRTAVDAGHARADAARIRSAMDALRAVAPGAGAYVSECDWFQPRWQDAFWGEHYPKLAAIKRKYDPDGLFFVHHGVGSEDWSVDGFSRVRRG